MPKISNSGLIGAEYQSRSRFLDVQECLNLYPEIEDKQSKNVSALIGTAGLRLVCDLSTSLPSIEGGIRGLHSAANGKCFAVCSNNLFEIFPNGGAKRICSLATVSGLVGMADNGYPVALLVGSGIEGDQLLVTDGKYGYLIEMSTGNIISIVSGFGSIAGTSPVFMDGYFIVNRPETGQFFFSSTYDGSQWDFSDYYTAEGSPDNLSAIVKTNNELWLVGKLTTEVWYNAGTNPSTGKPMFRRIQGAFIDIGTSAPKSVVAIGSDVFWLGSNQRGLGSVWMARGLTPTRISTHAIEHHISKMGRIDDAVGYGYQQEGHQFYVLNFLSAQKTFVFDIATGLWHQRSSYDMRINDHRAHRGICCASAFGKTLIGDHSLPKIYEFDLDQYTDDGANIVRRRTFPHTADNMRHVFFHEMEVEMDVGSGTVVETSPVASTIAIDDEFSEYEEGVFTSESGEVWDVSKNGVASGNLYIRHV